MSKIIKAINVMISNPDKITKVIRGNSVHDEFYFQYDGKYKWSIINNTEGAYILHYYPGVNKIEDMASMDDWDDTIQSISYNTTDLGTKEAHSSFKELFNLVKEKVFGMHEVLDDIIGDDDIF